MTEVKYTPGPWFIERITQSDYEHLYISHESKTRSQIIADLHCPISKYQDGHQELNENKMANARLITAAPELLEAIEGLRDEFRRNVGNCTSHDAWNRACAAIAKATQEV